MSILHAIRGRVLPSAENALPGYAGSNILFRFKYLMAAGFLFGMVALGVVIAQNGQEALLPLALVSAILMLLVIWAMPETLPPPLAAVSFFFFFFLGATFYWPDYLAISLPGLPWITALRLGAVPLLFVFLISLSVSPAMRQELWAALKETKVTTFMVLAVAGLWGLSVAYSTNITQSFDRYIVALLYWLLLFFAACWVFLSEKRINRFVYMLWAGVLLASVIGVREAEIQAIVWADSIPSFLKVEDPVVQKILAGGSRAAIGLHRVQAKFTTPLGLSEFMALALPFVLYLGVYGPNKIVKLAALATVPLAAYVIVLTDSRLGIVGLSLTVLLFSFAWAVLRWRQVKESVMGIALTLSFPVMFAVLFASTFVVGRIRARVWGTGAHQFSNQAREDQLMDAIPLILSRPWGYGLSRSGETLGYTNLLGVITIDSYYLSVALDIGVLGFILYFGIFISQIIYGSRILYNGADQQSLILIPAVIALVNFVVIKSIFAQVENHAIVFVLVGLVTAAVYTQSKRHTLIPTAKAVT